MRPTNAAPTDPTVSRRAAHPPEDARTLPPATGHAHPAPPAAAATLAGGNGHAPAPPRLFRSYFLAGFESACHVNRQCGRLDMLAATQHDRCAEEDYARLRRIGILAARDGVRWHRMEPRPGWYDFSSWAPMVAAARRHGIQVIWNLCHYGWPDGLDFFSAAWVERFARFCRAATRYLREQSDEVPFFTPVNEISFMTWAIARDGYMLPYAVGKGWEVKAQLIRASIAGTEAIWDVDPRARIMQAEPIIHIVAPKEAPELAALAAGEREGQFEAWDMLTGRTAPELGGHPKYLDLAGLNYYASNQWDAWGGFILWHVEPRDARWVPLYQLLQEVHQRYQRPLVLAETSHVGHGRGRWIREIGDEAVAARQLGLPLEGVCLYPIIDRPSWDDPSEWHHSGLWDLLPDGDGRLRRVLHENYAAELRQAQAKLAAIGCK